MSTVVFYRQGPIVRVSAENGNPPPRELCAAIENTLTYTHVTHLRGADTYDRISGQYTRVQTERRSLYVYQNGCPAFQRGYERRVWALCDSLGIKAHYVDLTPEHPRPDRFHFDPKRAIERIDFRPGQLECLRAISENEYGQVWAPTGFGKGTEIAALALAYPKAKILACTYRRDVVNTLESRIGKYLPGVGLVNGDSQRWGRVTVITAGSLGKVQHDIANEPDIFLYDELHEAPTPSRLEQLSRFVNTRNFGFTGSHNCRADGADFRLEGYFGPSIYHMTFPEAVAAGLIVQIRVKMVAVDLPNNPCRDMADTAKQRNGVWRNTGRNKVVAQVARQFADDEQTLTMVRSTEHAFFLKKMLPEYSLVYGPLDRDKYDWFIRQGLADPTQEPICTPQRRRELAWRFENNQLKKVICTDVWSTGVSFDSLGVMIRADAGSAKGKSMQAPGRTCRRDDSTGKQYGLLIDFRDNFDPGTQRWSNERERVYREMGWEVTRVQAADVMKDLPAQRRAAAST